MNTFFTKLLKNYDSRDQELLLKAKFVLLIILCGISVLIISLSYTAWLSGLSNLQFYTQSAGFAFMFVALVLLLKAKYEIAIHIIFITSFTVSWVILFGESDESLIIKLDTIVFIVGILAAMPVMLFKTRIPMVIYFVLNLIIFLVFNYYLHVTTDIPIEELLDYLLDTSVIMIFVSLVSFNSFSIFKQALGSLKLELKERIEIEEQLQKAMVQAKSGAQAKMEFLTNMSHEIRTPINGIMGMAELAMENKLDNDLKHIVSTIDSEAGQLLGIVNQILDFSKIEAGKLIIEDIDFNLRKLFDQTCASLSMVGGDKDIEFISFMSPKIPTGLIGDPGRIRQILVNLTSNAIKFTPHGEIYIKCEGINEDDTSVELRFFVKDTGIGIPREKQKKIFESFSQADGSTTRQYGGTGLGTAISKQLVELMGGKIGLESEEGNGSKFWFTIKLKKQIKKTGAEIKPEILLRGINVLVVDDNETNQYIFDQYLQSFGCKVWYAQNSHDGVSILEKHHAEHKPVDVIIQNFKRSEINGFEIAGKIRAINKFKNLPVILLTAMGKQHDASLFRDVGISGYLIKPIRKNELKQVLLSVLGRIDNDQPLYREIAPPYQAMENPGGNIKVLVVEDYPTNQKIVLQHLSKAGFQVTLAENGSQAVDLYRKCQFDLILMDIQMPEMDGYQATHCIRQAERKLAGANAGQGDTSDPRPSRIPIIAMTAHAIKGYREKCLEAGMDDYITKPLGKINLLEIVRKWSPSGIAKQSNQSVSKIGQTLAVDTKNTAHPWDYEKALGEFDMDEEFLMEVVNEFFDILSLQLPRIQEAIHGKDADVITKEAHAIKGGAANLTAYPLSKAAHDLELAGRSKDFAIISPLFNTLKDEFSRLKSYVDSQGI